MELRKTVFTPVQVTRPDQPEPEPDPVSFAQIQAEQILEDARRRAEEILDQARLEAELKAQELFESY